VQCRASDINTAVKHLFTEADTNTDGLPMRELLGPDQALRRHHGALVDKLNQNEGELGSTGYSHR